MSITGQPGRLGRLFPTISPRDRFREATCGNQVSEVSEVSGRRELTLDALALFEGLKREPTKPLPRGGRR